MGSWFSSSNKNQSKLESKQVTKSKLEEVDIVKARLKQAKYKIQQFINAKSKDCDQIQAKIKDTLPKYQQTKNKKLLIPLLKAKKDVSSMLDNAQIRLKLLNEKLSQVQLNQMNKQTITALDQSNSYIKQVQQQMEAKDWKTIIDQAQNKYQMQWPDDSQDIQQDQTFKEMWKELEGDKAVNKIVSKKSVNVVIQKQKEQLKQSQAKLNFA